MKITSGIRIYPDTALHRIAVVWRLVPVSCLLVIALTLLLMNIDFAESNDYLGAVAVDFEQPSLVELLGLEG